MSDSLRLHEHLHETEYLKESLHTASIAMKQKKSRLLHTSMGPIWRVQCVRMSHLLVMQTKLDQFFCTAPHKRSCKSA